MGKQKAFYLDFLQQELERRTNNNPLYSLRSFAKWLQVDPSLLSKILSRQKVISLEMADKVITKLSPEDKLIRDRFIKSASEEAACYALNKFDTELTDCDDDS